jgi:putative transposase
LRYHAHVKASSTEINLQANYSKLLKYIPLLIFRTSSGFSLLRQDPGPKAGGRRRTTNERRVIDGILYLLKTGRQWRRLPNDFPPWRTVCGYFTEWRMSNTWKKMQRKLYCMVRQASGRSRLPSIVVIDSQSVKTGKMGTERGYSGGKRVKGRKLHFAADSLGMPLAISVTAASVHDLTGARKVLPRVRKFLLRRSFSKIYGDGAYIAQSFKDWAKEKFEATVQISKNLAMPVQAVHSCVPTLGSRANFFAAARFSAAHYQL